MATLEFSRASVLRILHRLGSPMENLMLGASGQEPSAHRARPEALKRQKGPTDLSGFSKARIQHFLLFARLQPPLGTYGTEARALAESQGNQKLAFCLGCLALNKVIH